MNDDRSAVLLALMSSAPDMTVHRAASCWPPSPGSAAAWYYGELFRAAYNSSLLGARVASAAPSLAWQTKPKKRGFTIDALLDGGGESTASTTVDGERLDESRPEAFRGYCTDSFGGSGGYSPYVTVAAAAATASNRIAKLGCLDDVVECRKRSKRFRTVFTRGQARRLEAEFAKQQYMIGSERRRLADSLNLSEGQVKVWFQNRRIKWRRQNYELAAESAEMSQSAPDAICDMPVPQEGCESVELGESSEAASVAVADAAAAV